MKTTTKISRPETLPGATMQTETMLWLCNFKKKKKTTNVVLKQRNINKKTNPPASSLSVNLHRLQSNVSHRLRSYASHRLQSHDSQFMLSGSSTKKKSSRPETLAGTLMAKKIPLSGMTTMTKTKKEKLQRDTELRRSSLKFSNKFPSRTPSSKSFSKQHRLRRRCGLWKIREDSAEFQSACPDYRRFSAAHQRQ